MPYLKYAAIALIVADVLTTYAILRKGGSETTWALRWMMDRIGAAPALLISHGLLIAAFVWCPQFQHPALFALGLVVYGAMLVNNLDVLRKLSA